MKNQATRKDESIKQQSTETIEITPFHRSDIEYISQSNFFHSEVTIRRAHIFATTKNEYGYRCFTNQVFTKDVLIPNKSIHFVEDAAENWVNGIIE